MMKHKFLFKPKILLRTIIVLTIVGSHMAKAQPEVVVWGTVKNPREIEAQLYYVLDFLDVTEKVLISVNFNDKMPEGLYGLTSSSKCYCEYAQTIQVLIDSRKSVKNRYEILLHEMIHVKQFTKEELQVLSFNKVKWNGRIFKNIVSYGKNNTNRPWEREAHEMTRILSRLITENKKINKSSKLN
jgi:hypothetical protein